MCIPALISSAPYALRKPDDRFDVTIKDLHRMCESNGLNLYESVLYFHMPYMNISTTAMKRIYEGISLVDSLEPLELLTEQHCHQNPEIRKYLQYLTDLVQTCMDENRRVPEHKKRKIIDLFMTRVCSDIKYGKYLFSFSNNTFRSSKN